MMSRITAFGLDMPLTTIESNNIARAGSIDDMDNK